MITPDTQIPKSIYHHIPHHSSPIAHHRRNLTPSNYFLIASDIEQNPSQSAEPHHSSSSSQLPFRKLVESTRKRLMALLSRTEMRMLLPACHSRNFSLIELDNEN
jgi:hypothetical protein